MTNQNTVAAMTADMIGNHVLVRSPASGVHLGILEVVSDTGTAVRLKDSRRLWRWATGGTGISLSEVCIYGIDQKDSKITEIVPTMIVLDVCEIVPATGIAVSTIMGANVAKP